MKKFLAILVLGLSLMLFAQASKAIGKRGSIVWLEYSEYQELVIYYNELDLDELCHIWNFWHDRDERFRTRNRKAIKEALNNQIQDKYFCMKLPSAKN